MILCGIDGGQSSTRAVLTNEHGQLLGIGQGGPLIHLSMEGGSQQFVLSIRQAVEDACQAAKHLLPSIDGMVVGATGIFEDSVEASTATQLLETAQLARTTFVCSDALIALYGCHSGQPGIMVISGTGTIGYGMDQSGQLARAGGWGWPLGDAGSAYAIGRAGLRAALFAYDGLANATGLTERFATHFRVNEMHDIKRIFFAPDFGAPSFAALAPIVSDAAVAEDKVAQQIVENNGKALAQEAVAVASKLTFADSSIPVAPIGGAFDHIHGLRESFGKYLNELSAPRANLLTMTMPNMSAVAGAALMAIRRSKCGLTSDALTQIQGWSYE